MRLRTPLQFRCGTRAASEVHIVEIRVGQGRGFGAPTLERALSLPAVDDIVLAAGVHEAGSLHIKRSLGIRGEPGATLVGNLVLETGSVTVSELTLQGSVLAQSGVSASLRQVTVRAVELAGVFVGARSTVRLEESVVTGASGVNTAVRVAEDGILELDRSTIEGVDGNALQIFDMGRASLVRSRVAVPEAVAAAIYITGGARLMLVDTTATAGAGNALYGGDSASVEATDSSFRSQGLAAAIWLYGEASLAARGGEIAGTLAPAMNSVEDTRVRLDGVKVSTQSQEDAAVALWGHCRATVSGGAVSSSATHAILAQQDAEAVLEETALTGGVEGVPLVAAGENGHISLRHCRVTTGKAIAVLASQAARIDLRACAVERSGAIQTEEGFEGFLLMVEGEASLSLTGGTATVVSGSGLHVTGQGRATIRDLSIRCGDPAPSGYGIAMNQEAALTADGLHVEGFRHNLAVTGGTAELSGSLFGRTPDGKTSVWITAGRVLLTDSMVRDSGEWGVAVTGRATCELRDTTVVHAGAGGIHLGALAHATLTACVLADNRGHALWAEPESAGAVVRCIIKGEHRPPALRVDAGSSVVLDENVLAAPEDI